MGIRYAITRGLIVTMYRHTRMYIIDINMTCILCVQ